MTTTATKRMRFAALGLSTALSVGALAPFIGTSSASAVDCTTATAQYSTASSKLAVDTAKLKKAKKKYKKAKKHHASKATLHKKHKKVKKLKKKVAADRSVRNYYSTQRTTCTPATTGGGTTTPPATTSPLDLSSILSGLTSSGLDPSALTNALNALAAQVAAQGAGVPGSTAFADGLKAISDAIANNASSLSPAELQTLLSELPSSVDPTAFQNALQDAVTGLTNAATNPPTTANGLIDDVLNPVQAGLSEFPAAAPLNTLVGSVQDGLDQVLTDLGLPALGGLTGGSLSPADAAALLSNLGSADQASALFDQLDPSTLTNLLNSLAAADPTGLSTLLTSFSPTQLTSLQNQLPTGVLTSLLDTLGLGGLLGGLLG